LVTIGIYSAAGRLVRNLAAGKKTAGKHSVTWDTNDMHGSPAGNGLYFCSARIGGKFLWSTIILMK
jgi:flagellar hook assembly protein FlgD